MIVGAFIINKSQVISRFTEPLLPSKIESLILDFMQGKKMDIYKYISSINNGISYVLVTSLSYREVKGKKILGFLINNSTLDPVDQLVTLDNILYDGNFISPNLSLIKNMESQEEKIYNMMMKNKATEMKKKFNKMKKDTKKDKKEVNNNMSNLTNNTSILTNNMSNITNNMSNITNNITNLNINTTNKLRSFETSKNNIFVLIKEKLKCQVDIENTVKSVEINGEMILNIKSEDYKNISLTLKGDTSKCKFSPKLDKEASKNNIIRSNKDFSLNKNIALMKWKIQDIKQIPLTFTFWPSEVKLGTYQVSLEYTAEEDIKDLVINIPKKKMIDCNATCETEENIEWTVGTVRKGDSDTLDFQCKCNDIEDIFPMEVYFTSERVNSKIDIEDPLEDCEIRRVLEVEEFKLEYE